MLKPFPVHVHAGVCVRRAPEVPAPEGPGGSLCQGEERQSCSGNTLSVLSVQAESWLPLGPWKHLHLK